MNEPVEDRFYFKIIITLHDFNALTNKQQMRLHRRTDQKQQGQYLMIRYEDRFVVNLYAVDSFFVEAWYNPGTHQIERLRGFSAASVLKANANTFVG